MTAFKTFSYLNVGINCLNVSLLSLKKTALPCEEMLESMHIPKKES